MIKIPFYENSKDDTHCFQACLKSILKFYFPKKNYSFKYLDRATAHKKNKWTWNSAVFLFLEKFGFEIINIEDFDYAKFARLGEQYLKRIWIDEVFQTQKKFSDLKNEQKLAKKLIKNKKIKLLKRPATISDIKKLFIKNYIILVNINPFILNKKKGYSSHIVIITDMNKSKITFHDSGLPPQKNRKAPIKLFLKAMEYPYKEDASIIALRLFFL